MKIAVVGGGSTYTPELVDGLARMRGTLEVSELVLIDPAAGRLADIGPLGRRMFAREGHPGAVTWTTELEAGLAGAQFVLIQLRIGGQAARLSDETFPLACGCVGQETTGAGGLAKALRTVPEVLRIAAKARELAAPGAWLVDFTNPVGIVTRALLDAGHRAVGLCNVAIGFQRAIAAGLGVPAHRISLDHVGLNHLSWERSVRLDGTDILPSLLAEHGALIERQTKLPIELIRRLGVIPSYYLRYYYQHDPVVAELLESVPRATQVAEVERELLARYADSTLDTKPEELRRRGGAFYSEAAVELLAALHGDTGEVRTVNLRNHGLFPTLPGEAVIEVPARVTASGPVAVPTAPPDPLYAGLVTHVAAYEELAVEAALHGGRERVFRALLAHPLVGQAHLADRLTDDLLAANRDHLAWAR
ncbi:6-phospho-beta-glucosidase [Amycolatopsis alkalitolerans]|uniref:6-phospho-beta-glucosidase n=1 Tax=Amycolatopsis alkalitolerans TaxID=2547244 RepID=A0A5C4LTT7_9PSEU|nr:6-phospho-beta-glucosidase [Amycolatopsis alkalitolerans]TNC21010.1 6-phospho-beta-glucosidase [Amycolatopsis alkalitolerans]